MDTEICITRSFIALTPTGAFGDTLYDLVSRGTNTSGSNQCYGTYSSGTGTGAGYTNACIHSDIIESIGTATVWYNYAAASAGTITGTSNTTTATQSICPKGWALPSVAQIDSIGGAEPGSSTYVANFLPVLGGRYNGGSLGGVSTHGLWWTNNAYAEAERYSLRYTGSELYTSDNYRTFGLYIRCVSSS